MWGWICAGCAIAALVGWIVLRGGLYRRIFADEHYLEVAQGIIKLKAAALERMITTDEDDIRSPGDPRVLISSAGLALVYTIRRSESRFVHHYSVSISGGYTAHAVGESFVLLMARLLDVSSDSLAVGVARSTVHHAEFQLTSDEQAEYASRPVPEISLAEVSKFRTEWINVRERLHWHRLDV